MAKQQPDDAEWDAADVRYSVVRWMVQPGQGYAVGPSRTNPFTGEIFDADIRISADFVRYAHLEFTELVEHVFGPDAFRWSPELLNKLAPERWVDFTWSVFDIRRIDYPIHDRVLSIQRQPLDRFYDSTLLSRLQDLELRYEGEDTFGMVDLFTGLRQAIWAELETGDSIDSFRRNLQRAQLQKLIGLVLRPTWGTPEDARTLARADLQTIAAQIDTRLEGSGLDAYSRAHLEETKARIEAALEAGLERSL